MLGALVFCGLISRWLGTLYIAIVCLPIYATTVLNDWIYRGCYWTFRTVLRLLYMRRISALVALLAEIGLFLALWKCVAALLKKYGV